ncbi:hypothetical protein [Pinibacter aurantiacus]|uniref:Uncharacterized protein n=1 Tax=Pinibacter aurantiacus TaxID=2851599 RepID=A0A9E2S7A2_9BACT|nr:hypothetical protein [Pinibacter aurantiacus]MBV4355794.1 hypothetical protein [Pinibacter aurantiacus]
MEDYVISVNKIEDLQMTKDTVALDIIFQRAKSTIVGGCATILVRENRDGSKDKFEEFTSLEDLEAYKKRVYKFL